MQKENLDSAYQYCLAVARQHYENFPTASILLNPDQRRATAAIYAFARQADDLADEGQLNPDQRLKALDAYQHQLDQIYRGKTVDDPVFIALADVIHHYAIPHQTLSDLLIAFRMDVSKHRYADFAELLNYCQYSANPIGELVLRLHNTYDEHNKILSDRICTALQLINFMQDLAEDYQVRRRIYIPLDEMQHYAVSEDVFGGQTTSTQLEALVKMQLQRAQSMLFSGIELVDALPGKLKFVIMLTICSGNRVCEKILARRNCFVRPTLNWLDWVKIGLQLMYFRSLRARAKIQQIAQSVD